MLEQPLNMLFSALRSAAKNIMSETLLVKLYFENEKKIKI